MTVTEKEIIAFLLAAKKATYASENRPVQLSSRLGSKDLAFEQADFKYWDSYIGNSGFSGTEVVWYQEQPVWSMNYLGRMLTGTYGGEIRTFLMEALTLVDATTPYRGPAIYQNGKFTYTNTVTGDFEWFNGKEIISYENVPIYELIYHGGTVKK